MHLKVFVTNMEKLYSFISLVFFLSTLKSVTLATTLGTNRMFEIECNGGNYLSSRICLPLGYRKGEMPNTPVEIKTALTINHIREIDDKKMTVALEFHPVFVWIDNRIVANLTIEEQKYGVALNNIILNELWKPDLRVENIRSFQIHSIIEDISGLAIGGSRNNIVVWYEFTAKAVIYCNFHFQRYPMDVQECNFTIGSTYPAKQAAVFTMNTSAFNFATVTQNTDAFDLDMINLRNEDNQTEFGFTIRMKRRLQPYIMEFYIPSITIVLIAQVSFILSLESIPGRVGLLITLFLTLTNICIHQQVGNLHVLLISETCFFNIYEKISRLENIVLILCISRLRVQLQEVLRHLVSTC